MKRTVEGDIGMRYSVRGILDAAGPGKLSRISGLPVPRVTQLVQFLREHTDTLPSGNPGWRPWTGLWPAAPLRQPSPSRRYH